MQRILYLIIFLVVLFSCAKKEKKIMVSSEFHTKLNLGLDSLNRPIDSTTFYFPFYEFVKDSNKKINTIDSFMIWAYSDYLYRLEEPILSVKYLGNRMYRYFDGENNPKSIRLIKQENKIEVIIKYFQLNYDKSPIINKPIQPIIYFLNLAYWDSLTVLSKNAGMWQSFKSNNPDLGISKLIEGHSEYGYSILGNARVSWQNIKEFNELVSFFNMIEKLKFNKQLY